MCDLQKDKQRNIPYGLGQSSSPAEPGSRLMFWEIDDGFKCPVVGMCITMAEQKRLLKKSKYSIKCSSPFEIHEAIVASSDDENRISRRVDRLLQRKFGKEAANLLKCKPEDFLAHFKAADAAGDHAASLWATAIHPDLSYTIKREIFGEIHMSMHFSGEERMRLNRKLAAREREIKELRQGIKEIARIKRVQEKEIQNLKQNLTHLQVAVEAADRELAQIRRAAINQNHPAEGGDLNMEHHHLKSEAEALYRCNKKQQCQITALKERNQRLSSQLGYQGELNRRFRDETRAIITELVSKARCDRGCPSYDLCQKRILIVGGMSRMESLYRDLIEASGGVFEYHDGYMKKGSRQLESCLRRADLVLCPVNCNSHTACSMVKSLAKKHRKPVHMLANSSLQAISQAIWGAGDGRHMMN